MDKLLTFWAIIRAPFGAMKLCPFESPPWTSVLSLSLSQPFYAHQTIPFQHARTRPLVDAAACVRACNVAAARGGYVSFPPSMHQILVMPLPLVKCKTRRIRTNNDAHHHFCVTKTEIILLAPSTRGRVVSDRIMFRRNISAI